MRKAVLMSMQPKWCELIASGKKTVEVRKTKPKLDVPFKVYIYCTRYEKGKLIWKQGNKFLGYKLTDVSGKIIGEFACDSIIQIDYNKNGYGLDSFVINGVIAKSCVPEKELYHYLQGKRPYLWHISNLKIYDKPKELSEFYRKCEKMPCEGCEHLKYQRVNANEYDFDCEFFNYNVPLTRPPQSWCYVEELKDI